jgi:uncharacterized protein involved in exopolysaccharide biosynthesis
MEAIDIFDLLRRHVFLIVALCIVTTLSGYGISFFSPLIPEKYDASATLLVRPHNPIKIDQSIPNTEYLGFPVSQSPVIEAASKTYIRIIESPALIAEVVRRLKLDQEPRTTVSGSLFAQIYAPIVAFYNEDIQPYLDDAIAIVKYGSLLKKDPFAKAIDRVSKGLVLKSYEDTYVFEIQYSDKNPRTAAAVANTIARLFIEFLEKMRASEATNLAAHLNVDLEQSRQRLVAARERLQNYKASQQVFLLQPEYEAKLKVIGDLTVSLAKLDENLATGTLRTADYERERATLLKILDEQRAAVGPLPAIERELQLRQADVDVADATYLTVAKELKDAEIRAEPLPEARLISPAFVPQLPSHPRRGLIVLASLMAGLLVGVALAFFLEYIDRTVRRISDIEDAVGLKVIATLPLAMPFSQVGPPRHRLRLTAPEQPPPRNAR